MHPLDVRELRRQQRFKHVLSGKSEAAKPQPNETPITAKTVNVPVCTECGASSGRT